MTAHRIGDAALAYHEAGHAVIAYVLHLPHAHVTINHDRESGTSGRTIFNRKKPPTACTPSRAFRRELDEIDVCLAGPLAQSMFNRRSVRHWQSTDDFSKAMKLVMAGESDIDTCLRFIKGQMIRTERLLRKHWVVVDRVADALLEHRTLDGRHLGEVIKRARKITSSAQHRSRVRTRHECDHLFELFHRQVASWSSGEVVIYNAGTSNRGQS